MSASGAAPPGSSQHGAIALNIVQILERVDQEEIVRSTFQGFVESVGFASVTCATLSRSGHYEADRVLMTTRPAKFLEEYISRDCYGADPVLRELTRRHSAFRWSEIAGERPLSRAEQTVLALAADFGLADGLMIPVQESNGIIGLVNAAGPAVALDAEARAALILLATYVYRRLCAFRQKARGPVMDMTARESEILGWIAAGKSDWQIGQILGISSKTVNYHIEYVKRKFGVATRIQAVVAALERGAFRPEAESRP